MKRRNVFGRMLVAAFLTLGAALPAMSQETKGQQKMHRVVFDMGMEGEEKWEGVLRNVENVRSSLGEKATEVEVVVHGKALPLLTRTNTKSVETLRELSKSGVRFAACENTMNRMKVTKEMRLFALGLQQDWAAVQNAVRLEWSNGQTEGQVNRLKFLKRQMYGRANFDLLRARVLHQATA